MLRRPASWTRTGAVRRSIGPSSWFSEAAVSAAKKPKALAWEGCHYAEVAGWQELVLKVLAKLQRGRASIHSRF